MIGVFARKNPSNIVLLFFYGILLRLGYFTSPPGISTGDSDGRLYREIVTMLEPAGSQFPIIYTILAFLLQLWQALSLNRIINTQRLMNRPNYLPAMSYLLISSFFADWNRLSAGLLAGSLLVFVWSRLNRLQQTDRPKIIIFNAGMLLGVCNFIYSFSFAFMLLVFLALVIFRPFRLNEYLVGILGFATPWYFLFVWQYLNGYFEPAQWLLRFSLGLPRWGSAGWQLAGLLVLGATTLAGIYFTTQQSVKMLIQARKAWSLMFVFLLVSLFIPFVNPHFSNWVLCLAPLAAFIGCMFFYFPGKMFKSILHWLMVGFAVAVNYLVG